MIYQQVESTARMMFSYAQLTEETEKLVSLLSSLGIYLRRTGYPRESLWLFDCGLKSSRILVNRQVISLLTSKGTSLSYLNQHEQAKQQYTIALKAAQDIKANDFD